jgi:outer membrane immunogenic protein
MRGGGKSPVFPIQSFHPGNDRAPEPQVGGREVGCCHQEFVMSHIIAIVRSLAAARSRSRLNRLPAVLGAALVCAPPLTAASAADLPTKATAAPAPSAYKWSGCYIGANAGIGGSASQFSSSVGTGSHLSDADAALVGANGTGSNNDIGFSGGGQAGCNWQSGTIVFGLEGDFDYFHSNPQFINGTNTLSDGVTPFSVSQSLRTDFFSTVRPRIGIAADRNLAYITGGAAFSQVSYTQNYADALVPASASITSPGSGTATGSKSLVGWTAGAGWEHAFADHWTFKIEYLYASFAGGLSASGAITDTAGGTNPLHGSADLTVQMLRAGVNYKF